MGFTVRVHVSAGAAVALGVGRAQVVAAPLEVGRVTDGAAPVTHAAARDGVRAGTAAVVARNTVGGIVGASADAPPAPSARVVLAVVGLGGRSRVAADRYIQHQCKHVTQD